MARTIDPARQVNYVDRNAGLSSATQKWLERLENRIPGLSMRNQAYVNEWGEEEISQNAILRVFENFLSPGYLSKIDKNAVVAQL